MNCSFAFVIDSLLHRNEFNIGTTGFLLPQYEKYNISGLNHTPLMRYGMKISYLAIQRKFNSNYSFVLAYNGFRTKPVAVVVTEIPKYELYKSLNMFSFSAGISRNLIRNVSHKVSLETKVSGFVQYRTINEDIYGELHFRREYFQSPGVKLSISENVVLHNRFVIGINAGAETYYQKMKGTMLDTYNFIFSNALYLGVKF